MEVHAHTHTERKKWTHYFWEFLMLFLAVFCGFLAETQREHMVERQREGQYMQSLLSDLSADTAMIHAAIPRKEGRINAVDSVFIFFKANPNTEKINGKLFKTIRRTNFDSRFIRNTITINQLKNAGGMRLIRKKEVADSISSYDFRCEATEIYNDLYIINSQLGNRQFEKLFKASDLLTLYIENSQAPIVANIPDLIVIGINTAELNGQLNFMMLEKSYARQEIERYKELEGRAVRLMELIKKEYHMK
ncbi:MAG TPA: hypothetical protein VKB95_10930 [Chitinophagaceae bacterium]|nr:hypothetical protein [Chitinophagaceae bacterium]